MKNLMRFAVVCAALAASHLMGVKMARVLATTSVEVAAAQVAPPARP